ncbi:checkpoint clamp complex protein Rad1 [Coemansia sp. RSA 2559]|nr:checkpoint clamp complex protein Rad1 [Coemansia sp. RSA 2559]KAJ2867827.1 checkpoint clamp complex protein Rad1 [Coemansia erecta]
MGLSRDVNTAEAAEQSVFTAKLINVRPLVNMLKTIGFRPRAICTISSSGIVFTVEDAQCIVAQAYLRTTLFSIFDYNTQLAKERNMARLAEIDPEAHGEEIEAASETTQISLPLDNLIECLSLFYGPSGSNSFSGSGGSNQGGIQSTSGALGNQNPLDLRGATTAHIAFNGPGSDFELVLEERGIISMCRLATFMPDVPVDLEFAKFPIVQQLIIRSEWLRDAFNELDPTSDAVTLSISSTAPYFRISTIGNNGSTDMTYSKDEQILDSFYCNEEQENRYKLSQILKCRQALAMSDKTKIRVNQRGFLSFQFMIPTDVDVSFVNFVYAPLLHADELADDAVRYS